MKTKLRATHKQLKKASTTITDLNAVEVLYFEV